MEIDKSNLVAIHPRAFMRDPVSTWPFHVKCGHPGLTFFSPII